MYASTVQSAPLSANTALLRHPCFQTSYPPSAHSVSSPSAPHHRALLLAALLHLLPPLLFLIHFLSIQPVDLIFIQESNLTHLPLSRFTALRSDRTHSRSGILSRDATHASNGVVIFVRWGISFSELSISSLSSLDPYFDDVGVNISLNNSSLLSFLNVYALLFAPPRPMTELTLFLPPFFPPPEIPSFWGNFNCHHPLWDSRVTSNLRREEVFDWVIFSDLLPLNDPETLTLLHRSSGSRSSPDLSFDPSSLALSCLWEVLQDLGSDHLPIFLPVPLFVVFLPNECPPSFNFQKACWDDFASYFDSHCPSAEEY